VEQTSQVVALFFSFSSMRLCGTDFTSCDSFLFLIHETVEQTSQVATHFSFSSMRLCGTDFISCNSFLFLIHETVYNKLHSDLPVSQIYEEYDEPSCA
jgi:hypothetical protein